MSVNDLFGGGDTMRKCMFERDAVSRGEGADPVRFQFPLIGSPSPRGGENPPEASAFSQLIKSKQAGLGETQLTEGFESEGNSGEIQVEK